MEDYNRLIPKNLEEVKELYKEGNVMLDIKSLQDVNEKAAIIKYALTKEDLTDPLMIMNLINLVKIYNTLEDAYFESKDVYVNSVEELLDLKLALSADLKEFARKITFYFLSLFKSYVKTSYTDTDKYIELPKLYESIFCNVDFLTLSGIASKAPEISTKDLVYVEGAYKYFSLLIIKGMDAINMMKDIFVGEGEE